MDQEDIYDEVIEIKDKLSSLLMDNLYQLPESVAAQLDEIYEDLARLASELV